MIVVRFDTRALVARCHRMAAYMPRAISVSAGILTTDMRKKTRAGLAADNTVFPSWYPQGDTVTASAGSVYSPSQTRRRRAAGKQVGRKDLSVTNAMLKSLGLHGKSVTVGDQYERIAHGQMHHPTWRYHHEFLYAGMDTVAKITQTNARNILK